MTTKTTKKLTPEEDRDADIVFEVFVEKPEFYKAYKRHQDAVLDQHRMRY